MTGKLKRDNKDFPDFHIPNSWFFILIGQPSGEKRNTARHVRLIGFFEMVHHQLEEAPDKYEYYQGD